MEKVKLESEARNLFGFFCAWVDVVQLGFRKKLFPSECKLQEKKNIKLTKFESYFTPE